MSNTITMTLTNIKGESKILKDAVDVSNYSYHASRNLTLKGDGELDYGTVVVSPIALYKPVCKASAALEVQFYKGQGFDEVVITEYKSDGTEAPKPSVRITLKNAYIISYQVSVGGTEAFEMTCASIKREYFNRDTKTGQLAQSGVVEYDLLTRVSSK
jgi:type VI protein secretion system component Hcp